MDPKEYDPFVIGAICFMLSALGALGELLLSTRRLSPRVVLGTLLYAGLVGSAFSMFWMVYLREQMHIAFLVCVCTFAGLGGTPFLKLVVELVSRAIMWGIKIINKFSDKASGEK